MGKQPFSVGWVIASIVIFTALELAIAIFLAPAILAGRLASEMWRIRVEMMMHLGSFYAGGVVVGIISPRVRLTEPAVGAFVSVVLVWLMSVFMPYGWWHFDMTKLIVGGGIAFALALMGAYTGERVMGNLPDDPARLSTSSRAQLREKLWGVDGVLSRTEDRRWLE